MPPEWITCIAAVTTAVAAGVGGWLVRGSTAVPAAAWATAAAIALAIEAVSRRLGGLNDPAACAAVRLAVVSLGACPVMSLLGAKRPQHGVWQLIVASLAGVLALPAVAAILVRPGSMPDMHLLARGLLAVVLLVGLANFIATRHALAATLVTVGQAGLSWQFLPAGWSAPAVTDAVSACCMAVGAVSAAVQSVCWPAGARRRSRSGLAAVCDPPFLAIRESLGAAWALRIAERFNAEAAARGWPCRLGFAGLQVFPEAAPGHWERAATGCLRAILRRFVSLAWLRRHGQLSPSSRDRGHRPERSPVVAPSNEW